MEASRRRAVVAAMAACAVVALAACSGRNAGRSDPMAPDVAQAVSPPGVDPAVDGKPDVGMSSTRPLVIVTGAERETDVEIGRDLARLVAAPARLDLQVRTSRGAADNLHRLREDAGVHLAIVQYDVIQAFIDQSAQGNPAAADIVEPLRIVAPLYTQELYFLTRHDSELQSVGQIRGRKINVGVVGSGSALTAAALYRRLFDAPIAAAKVTYLDDQKALTALTVDRSIDVMVVVAGQPTRLLAAMRPEARAAIKLLPVDPRDASSRAAFRDYLPATIRKSSYPQWLAQDVPTLSVMSFLVTMTGKGAVAEREVADFTGSLCQRIGDLRRDGHPKWREVDLTLKLGGPGWNFATSSTEALERCPADGRSTASGTNR